MIGPVFLMLKPIKRHNVIDLRFIFSSDSDNGEKVILEKYDLFYPFFTLELQVIFQLLFASPERP